MRGNVTLYKSPGGAHSQAVSVQTLSKWERLYIKEVHKVAAIPLPKGVSR